MSPGQILVVDDDAAFRALLVALLERAGFEPEQAGSCEEALAAARGSRPRLVLLEVCLPDGSGFEFCRELRDLYGDDLPIIFLSGERTEPLDCAAGLLVGGDDYVLKPFHPDLLLARIRRCLDRVDAASGAVPARHGGLPLTPRELQILQLLAEGNDPKTIAERLVISPKTVASHLQRVMAKLGVHSRVHAVARAYEVGMIAPADVSLPDRDFELHASFS
jgi:two-component system, NarL family, nitrate/nitrite response regulator NarL